MKKVAFLSRHDLSTGQIDELKQLLGDDIIVDKINLIWEATTDEQHDNELNRKIWKGLYEKFDVVAGVFPPVALAVRPDGKKLLTPVSKQDRKTRSDGSAVIEFTHLRWVLF